MLLFKPLASRLMVSTHSRPKAAGRNWRCPHWVTRWFQHTAARRRLAAIPACLPLPTRFQHTAARRRLDVPLTKRAIALLVSTHSRPKAAGTLWTRHSLPPKCFNTQPPEGGWQGAVGKIALGAGFNTQPPEGGWLGALLPAAILPPVSTHSRPKAAGLDNTILHLKLYGFQHTAARRRLVGLMGEKSGYPCFNTQPPEGGWYQADNFQLTLQQFQHTAARRRLVQP